MTDKEDLDTNRDRDPGEPAREAKAIAPTPTGGASTSLSKLDAMLSRVDVASVIGRSTGRPMLQYHSRDGGAWTYGQKKTVVEEGSTWAANPLTFQWGWICWDDNNKPTERLVSVSQPMPAMKDLPDTGFEWQEQMAVGMKCLSGTDAGVEVVFKTNTDGGKQAVVELIETVQNWLASQHDGNVAPILTLGSDSYLHQKHSRIWIPVLTVIGWMSMDGPAPAPASPPPPPTPPTSASSEPQPRRRRVA